MVRIYFDVCSLQRPLDDRAQLRVAVEADAVVALIGLCETGSLGLISSFALDFEVDKNPNPIRRDFARRVLRRAIRRVERTPELELFALDLVLGGGVKPLDALHLACALEGEADYFCTCDDRLLKKARGLEWPMTMVTPLGLVSELES